MKDNTSLRLKWALGGFVLNAWWPVLAFVAWLVHIHIQGRYLAGLLSASGMSMSPTLADILFLHRQDLMLFGVLAPLFTIICYRWLSAGRATAIVVVCIFFAQFFLYANQQSWGQTGSFFSWQGLINAISFGISNPEFIGDYLTVRGLTKLAALLLASSAVVFIGMLSRNHIWLTSIGAAVGYSLIAGFLLLAVLGYTSNIRSVPITNSFFINAARAVLPDAQAERGATMSDKELSKLFASLSNIERPSFRGKNFGVHRGSNLILFILETASIEFLDVRRDFPSSPAFNVLRNKLFRAGNHFATFPASAESNLSIFTGMYPPRAIYGTCLIDIPRTGKFLKSPIGDLRERGYATALYAPFRSQVPADKTVFEGVGFENVIYGNALGPVRGSDDRAFARMLSDIKEWAVEKKPFATAFLPQRGHGPWPSALGETIKDRGSHVVAQQLNWLDQLIEVLHDNEMLENTVIVLTGDHGVRTMSEDSNVKVGMIDWYSFHVPLLIYASKADFSAVDAALPSSHVDIPVTISELFGLDYLYTYQGIALDHPDRADRRQYMMAGWYYGANGYRDNTESAMYSDLLDAVFRRSDSMVEFRQGDLVVDGAEYVRIRNLLTKMTTMQESWIADRACAPAAEAASNP